MKKKNVICFIAARMGSKRIPKKNIRKIGGKPLIAYTIEKALDSKIFDHVIVSTESEEIARIARKFGADVPFLRPKKLANDFSTVREVMIHDIKKLKEIGYNFEVLVNRDCTAPFIRNKDISNSIKLLKKKKGDAVIAVYKQHFNPYFNIVEINSKGLLRLCKGTGYTLKRRKEVPLVYQISGLHIFDVNRLLKFGNKWSPKTIPYEIPPETGLMIDTELEFQIAKLMFKHHLIS